MITTTINNSFENGLSKELKGKYAEILEIFSGMLKEWKEKDGFNEIRVGHELDKKILDFLVMFTDYMLIKYDTLDIKSWSKFLSTFPINFYYGDSGDEFNYIYDGGLEDIFLTKLNDFEKTISLKKLNSISKRFKELRKELD